MVSEMKKNIDENPYINLGKGKVGTGAVALEEQRIEKENLLGIIKSENQLRGMMQDLEKESKHIMAAEQRERNFNRSFADIKKDEEFLFAQVKKERLGNVAKQKKDFDNAVDEQKKSMIPQSEDEKDRRR